MTQSTDEVAERIAALGASPQGTPDGIIKDPDWHDYSLGRDTVQAHLAALDLVYHGVIEDIRNAIESSGGTLAHAGGVSQSRRAQLRRTRHPSCAE